MLQNFYICHVVVKVGILQRSSIQGLQTTSNNFVLKNKNDESQRKYSNFANKCLKNMTSEMLYFAVLHP